MSDSFITDLAGLSAPLTKLCETAAAGLGRLYEPTHIRRMAKAKADEIKLISEAIQNNPEIPIKYDDGKLIVDGTDFTELAKRAQQRFVSQELKKQHNLDSIIAQAAVTLKDADSVDKSPVDPNWISRFFDTAAHISTEEMHLIWGKILAGEITTGGSFSIRTLELLKNFSMHDAILFKKFSSYVLNSDKLYYIFNAEKILDKCRITYDELLQLSDCGMLNIQPFQTITFTVQKGGFSRIRNDWNFIFIGNSGSDEIKLQYNCLFLTQSAKELYQLVAEKGNKEYMKAIADEIKSKFPHNHSLSMQMQLSAKD